MTNVYRIFGSEMSPYSVKVRSFARYKGVPHEWVPRGPDNEEDYRKIAKLPIVPTVATPDGQGMQDSTPIMEAWDKLYPEPSVHPDGALGFLSVLLEEFGDEWGNKLMFHHRWWDPVDQASASRILARLSLPQGSRSEVEERSAQVQARMSGRGGFVGSSAATAAMISAYFLDLVDLLQTHLASRRYLFGGRPSFGDFGLAAQLYEASVDPTCSADLRARGPAVLEWGNRMIDPRMDGPFETWEALAPTLKPLLAHVGQCFLPWTAANETALKEGRADFTVNLPHGAYVQAPQKYHTKSLGVLRAKYAAARTDDRLVQILRETGCEPFLT
jgi:glutathione S-transferase